MSPRVFIVHNHLAYDTFHHQFKPKYDVSTAGEYGQLKSLYAPNSPRVEFEDAMLSLQRGLEDFTAQDYILCIGNPVLIGWAIALAAEALDDGNVKCLHWSGKHQHYECIALPLFPDCER